MQIPSLQRVLIAFWHALVARAHSRITRCRSKIESRKLALEAGKLKNLPAVPILSVTIPMLLGIYISGRGRSYGGTAKEIYS
uniref:Putative secreted protein n=1 Tax=Ixodes ricinus TaxID=34613 RepID=A0A6B0TYV2_IXORI